MNAIDAKREEIDAKQLSAGKIEKCCKNLDTSIEEHARFQTLKTMAVASGKLYVEEGQTIYVMLGEIVSVFNNQDVAIKVVLTLLFQELLEGSRD